MTIILNNTVKNLDELLWKISETEGLDNVVLIHSLLVCAAEYCETKYNIEILSEIFENGELRDRDLEGKSDLFRRIYYYFRSNVRHGVDGEDSPMNMQSEMPFQIEEGLRLSGLSDEELLNIVKCSFHRSINISLPSAYIQNEHFKRETHNTH